MTIAPYDSDWVRCDCGHDELSIYAVRWNGRKYCQQCTDDANDRLADEARDRRAEEVL